MLDPVIDFIKRFFAAIIGAIVGAWRAIRGFGRFIACAFTFRSPDPQKPLRVGAKLRRFSGAILLFILFGWYGDYFAHALVINGFDYDYPGKIVKLTTFSAGHETTEPESGTSGSKSCGRSQLVDMEVHLIHFVVDDNKWVPSMIQHKMGIVGYPWDKTPFFDRKSAFEKGVMKAIRRVSVELVDTLGRVRGTSSADDDLEKARGLLQFDEETWWINPFDSQRPFGPVTPSDEFYRKAIPLFDSYNTRLSKCEALFDARRDNLYQFLDRISKDLGSTTDKLAKRSRSQMWDLKQRKFVPAEGNDWGWFDFPADAMFWEALGEAYAYHGILQASREDLIEAVDNFRLQDVFDQAESNMAEAILLWPLVVSNGAEDATFMPSHLATLSQRILRARASIVEMRDVLSK